MKEIIASGDPTNVVLASVWSFILLFCLWLTWYAYFLWKRNPNSSISHNIAVWAKGKGMLIGFVLGLLIGVGFGVFLGLFSGHWFWPVELN